MTGNRSTLQIIPTGAALGALVHGVDLSAPLDPVTRKALYDAWLEHLVLIFPDQEISDTAHIRFGKHFGRLEIHPSLAHRASANPEIYRVSNVDEDGALMAANNTAWQYLNQSWLWHSDSSFREVPSKGSILHGIETTREGGNTRFANMYAAYEALDDATKHRIRGLQVVHDHDYIISLSPQLSKKRDQGEYAPMPRVVHPLVHIHPETKRPSLFVSPHTMVNIEGMADSEGRALLDRLIDHAIDERFVYRHIWSDHDVLMWDNRCTIHSVEAFDNTTVRRIMHRVTLAGEQAPTAASEH